MLLRLEGLNYLARRGQEYAAVARPPVV